MDEWVFGIHNQIHVLPILYAHQDENILMCCESCFVLDWHAYKLAILVHKVVLFYPVLTYSEYESNQSLFLFLNSEWLADQCREAASLIFQVPDEATFESRRFAFTKCQRYIQ